MPTISPDDDALDRRVRAIVEAVDACRRALIDLTIEDKLNVAKAIADTSGSLASAHS